MTNTAKWYYKQGNLMLHQENNNSNSNYTTLNESGVVFVSVFLRTPSWTLKIKLQFWQVFHYFAVDKCDYLNVHTLFVPVWPLTTAKHCNDLCPSKSQILMLAMNQFAAFSIHFLKNGRVMQLVITLCIRVTLMLNLQQLGLGLSNVFTFNDNKM